MLTFKVFNIDICKTRMNRQNMFLEVLMFCNRPTDIKLINKTI